MKITIRGKEYDAPAQLSGLKSLPLSIGVGLFDEDKGELVDWANLSSAEQQKVLMKSFAKPANQGKIAYGLKQLIPSLPVSLVDWHHYTYADGKEEDTWVLELEADEIMSIIQAYTQKPEPEIDYEARIAELTARVEELKAQTAT